MKTKFLLLAFVFLKLTVFNHAFAQDDEDMIFPETDTESSYQGANTPPVLIDESDSQEVSNVEEYDG